MLGCRLNMLNMTNVLHMQLYGLSDLIIIVAAPWSGGYCGFNMSVCRK